MSETRTTLTDASPEVAPGKSIPIHRSDILVKYRHRFLAPMFLKGSDDDICLARMAAFEMLDAYHARNYAYLIAPGDFMMSPCGTLTFLLSAVRSPPRVRLRKENGINAFHSDNRLRRAGRPTWPLASEQHVMSE